MTDDDKPDYRIGSGVNGVFALTDAKIAPRNPDGTYGEPIPLTVSPEFISFAKALPTDFPDPITFNVADMKMLWEFTEMDRQTAEYMRRFFSIPFYPFRKRHSRKIEHAMARKRERAARRK